MELKTDAIVLKTLDYKDNDKLLTLFTPDRGKLTAGIKGVRRSGAKLSFAAQPFCFAEYVLAERGGRYTVTGAYMYDGFFPLRTDIERYYAACTVLELCDALTVEDGDHHALFIAAVGALKNLSLTDGDSAEIVCTFALTALLDAGYGIDLDGCGVCGAEPTGNICFDFSAGHFTCPACAAGLRASTSTYAFLRRAAGLKHDENGTGGGHKRALKLIRTYLAMKTEKEYPCFFEYIKLYIERTPSDGQGEGM